MKHYGRFGPATMAPPTDPFDGLLLVDKPLGPTSHDIVAQVRRQFGFKKVGHGGTLDPDAGGLLVLLIGKGTRLSQQVMGGDKTYDGTLCLGVRTDSLDAQGQVIETADPSGVTREALEAAMRAKVGDSYQIPPMVSAVKVQGVPLHKLARKGKTVERQPRLVHVYRFKMTDWEPPRASFRVRTSKGVYVRTLCDDLGQALGCGAHLCALRRIESSGFSVDDALPMPALLEMERDTLRQHVIPYFTYLRQQALAPGPGSEPGLPNDTA